MYIPGEANGSGLGRGAEIKQEPKPEDTSRPRGRPPTTIKTETGTDATDKPRGRRPGSK